MRTGLGLFYDRHRRFVTGPTALDANAVEYTDDEWNRTFATFLSSLAREFGLVQAPGWEEVPQLMWFWHGVPDRPAVVIREVNVAGDTIVDQEIPAMVRSGALLTVLVIYPDYPSPPGVSSVEEATEAWRTRVQEELTHLGVNNEFLLTTISAFSWEIPAPWKGFAWHPTQKAMSPVD
ncbi:MAG: hypothetical protein ACHQ0I_03780 [Candidatus Lutacidiplasmatales archaeon]